MHDSVTLIKEHEDNTHIAGAEVAVKVLVHRCARVLWHAVSASATTTTPCFRPMTAWLILPSTSARY